MAVNDLSNENCGASNTVALTATDALVDLQDALEPAATECLERALTCTGDAPLSSAQRERDPRFSQCSQDAVSQPDDWRGRVIERFRGALAAVFQAGNVAAAPGAAWRDDITGDEEARLEAAVSRLRDRHRLALAELEQRLRHVLAIDARAICPCDPDGMMRAASAALRASRIGTASRIAIYEDFEAQLLATLGGLYATLNAEFCAAGLMADGDEPWVGR